MIESLKKQWQRLRAAPAGRRFQLRYETRKKERKTVARRVLWSGASFLLILVGLVFFALPGPGIVLVGVGAAILARESLTVARLLDRAELAVRGRGRRA
jgi:hypothetical protein